MLTTQRITPTRTNHPPDAPLSPDSLPAPRRPQPRNQGGQAAREPHSEADRSPSEPTKQKVGKHSYQSNTREPCSNKTFDRILTLGPGRKNKIGPKVLPQRGQRERRPEVSPVEAPSEAKRPSTWVWSRVAASSDAPVSALACRGRQVQFLECRSASVIGSGLLLRCRLQGWHAPRVFSRVSGPPWDLGMTWSAVSLRPVQMPGYLRRQSGSSRMTWATSLVHGRPSAGRSGMVWPVVVASALAWIEDFGVAPPLFAGSGQVDV